MRVAILSESSADEAALRVLVDAVLGIRTSAVADLPLRSRGVDAVRATLPAIIRHLHYHTDADGLVVVVDSNHTSLEATAAKNRLLEFRDMAGNVHSNLGAVAGRVPLRIAVGVAAPAIEAWLLCKQDQHISEAAWEEGLQNQRDPYSKVELKRQLYGVKFASLI